MSAPLKLHVGRTFWLSRGGALVAIAALHVGAIGLAMAVRGPRPDPAAPDPIHVMILPESRSEPPPPQQKVVMVDPVLVPPVMPLVQIEIPPQPTAITVAALPQPSPPAPAPMPRSSAQGDEPVAVSEVDYVRQPAVVYPPAAKKARAQGTVEVNVLVDVEGHPREARVHRSSGFAALDNAALESVLAALFRPYVQDGIPRSMRVIVPINFSLFTRSAQHRGKDRSHGRRDEIPPPEDRHIVVQGP